MDVPYQTRYRSRLQRLLSIRRLSALKVLRRPMVQWTLSAMLVLAATIWLHGKTPEHLGQEQMVQRAADSANSITRQG